MGKKAVAMKAATRKAMKTKRVTKVAHGRLAKALVLKGRKEKTSGGLTKDMLMVNKRGKIVSKRASAHGRRHYKQVEDWVEAVMGARDLLRLRLHSRVHRCSLGAPYNVATLIRPPPSRNHIIRGWTRVRSAMARGPHRVWSSRGAW